MSTTPNQLSFQLPPQFSRQLTEYARAVSNACTLDSVRYWEQTLQQPRYQEPKRLLVHGHKVYSQNDEDGLLAEILRRVGAPARRFVEIGVQTGVECNSTNLLLEGWSGVWIDGGAGHFPAIRQRFGQLIDAGRLQALCEYVTPENVNALLRAACGGNEVDVLSIDIDMADYWVWKALELRPRVLMIEYNASWRPPAAIVVPYDAQRRWDGTNYFGASLGALEKLGREKGYSLVGCCFAGVNAFFVRDDLVGDRFCAPFTAVNHYEPPRYYLNFPAGHRPSFGPVVEV